jgi:hypothetical protein
VREWALSLIRSLPERTLASEPPPWDAYSRPDHRS